MKISRRLGLSFLALALAFAAASAVSAADKYYGIASVAGPNGQLETPIRITIDRLTSSEERQKLIDAVKAGGNESAKVVLAAAPAAGSIELHDRSATLRYAYLQKAGAESILTVVTSEPLAFVGSKQPDAKPVAGYDLAIATLYLDDNGRGRGELSLAAKIKVRDDGLVSAIDYADTLAPLKQIERKRE